MVAARNEEGHIARCIENLLGQSYPHDRYEVIVVDDGSTDGTASIVRNAAKKNASLILLQLDDVPGSRVGRKPIALHAGITRARGEVILTTDADCIVPATWVETMAGFFDADVGFVAGPVLESSRETLFSSMEGLEFLGLTTVAAGLIGAGTPVICNGANLAYRKDIYVRVGGFGDHASSNDDEFLMNRIAMRKAGRIVFAADVRALVLTESGNTPASFLRQRLRWAAKKGHYEQKRIILQLVGLYLFFASFLFTMSLIPVEPGLAIPLSIVFVGKIFVDYFALRAGGRVFARSLPAAPFLIAELLHIPYIVVVAALAQVVSLRWKERTLRQ